MFTSLVARVQAEISNIGTVLAATDTLRRYLEEDAPDCEADELAAVRAQGPDPTAWRLFDHCAAFTSMYSSYERFVFDLVGAWLNLLPALYPAYADLPEAIQNQHRQGVAEVLGKVGGGRYTHLTTEGTIRGLFVGISGGNEYGLLLDAFLTPDRNLRQDVLVDILAGMGIKEPWKALSSDRQLKRWLEENRGNQETVESELAKFVQFRNEAAHGTVDEIVGPEEAMRYGEFAVELCAALARLASAQILRRELAIGNAAEIGTVIQSFSGGIIGCRMRPCEVSVGDEVAIIDRTVGRVVTVESIEVDHSPFDRLDCTDGLEVGFKVGVTAHPGALVLRRNPPAVAGGGPTPLAEEGDVEEGQPLDSTAAIPEPVVEAEG